MSQQLSTCVLYERLQGLKDQGLRCYRFFGASSIEPILIMLRGCGKNLPNPSISSSMTKGNWHGILRERRKPPLLKPIPNDLITADIQGEQYYNAYLEKVAKHQRYLAGEKVSDPDSPAPKPAKAPKPQATKQSKPAAPKAALVAKPAAAKASKSASSQPPKPKPAPTKPQEKKRKRMIDEAVDKGVLEMEPAYNQEEADNQKAVEESLKDVHAAHQGLLPLVVIREPKSGKFQPLPEVHGKGKEEVDEEQVARVLLNAPTESSSHDESSSIYAELGLTDSETESDEEVSGIDVGVQDEGQAGSNPGVQDVTIST
ncbi:hypothetical protein Tco_1026880 [Tanacetum coccineum]